MENDVKYNPDIATESTVPPPRRVIRMPCGDRSYDDYEYDMRLAHPEYMTEKERKGTPR